MDMDMDLTISAELTVPVDRVPALLILADGRNRRVTLFAEHGRRVGELLESDAWFIPAHDGVRTHMYARSALACIAVACGGEEEPDIPLVRRPIVARLRSGRILTGELRFVAPPERRRTTDHLNDAAPYFTLHDGGFAYHVVKAHVECVEEVAP